MLSAVILSRHSYAAMLLAEQQPHQRSVQLGPLVLESNLLKNQRLQQIGDQPVSRLYFSRSLGAMDYMIIFLGL
jgi:hypothetical protein